MAWWNSVSSSLEPSGHLFQLRVGQEMGQAGQKRKRVFLNVGMDAPLDEAQFLEALPRQEPLVPQGNQTVGDLGGLQADFLRFELLVAAPVAEVDSEQDALPGQGWKTSLFCVSIGFKFVAIDTEKGICEPWKQRGAVRSWAWGRLEEE